MRKLISDKGETFTEVLASMLIISLASLLLASMIMASSRIIKKSIKSYNLYVSQVNSLNTGTAKSTDSELGFHSMEGTVSLLKSGQETPVSIPVNVYYIEKDGVITMERYDAR